MKRFKFASSVYLLTVLGGFACNSNSTSSLDIYNGEYTGEKWNATGALLVGGQNFCSVSLIHPKVAITAAHCLNEFTTADTPFLELTFEADAEIELIPRRKGNIVKVKSFGFRDISYFHMTRQNNFDVGYLLLETPVDDVSIIPPLLDYYERRDSLLPGKTVTIVGYGNREDGYSGKRQSTEVTIESINSSEVNFTSEEGKGSCFGDSGGPAFLQLANKW
ncbi:MAG: trypsin-like serine protease [Pseudobacteriovorax sp.]|nr:trypsin-like serine protease [Pseudobacteriovorax sp.]